MEHRRFGFDERILPIVEISLFVLHIANGPGGYRVCEFIAGGVALRKSGQGVDGLRHALNVDRVSSRVVVLRATIVFKEMILVEGQPAVEVGTKLLVATRFDVTIQTIEIVPRMEIVDPVIL